MRANVSSHSCVIFMILNHLCWLDVRRTSGFHRMNLQLFSSVICPLGSELQRSPDGVEECVTCRKGFFRADRDAERCTRCPEPFTTPGQEGSDTNANHDSADDCRLRAYLCSSLLAWKLENEKAPVGLGRNHRNKISGFCTKPKPKKVKKTQHSTAELPVV